MLMTNAKMLKLVALFLVIAVAAPSAMAAEECTVNEAAITNAGGYGTAVEAAVKAAPDCERAFRTLDACQLGSSWDNALSDIVRAKCEPLFIGKANAGTMKAYKRKQASCAMIAKKNEGTMYMGLAAVCQARAARDFASKYAKGR
jgi:hypothetical protein